MKFSEKWLRDWVNPACTTQQLCSILTMAGLEVESTTLIDDDTIIELKVTPNRGDCLSILGIAREVAALTGSSVKRFETEDIVPTISETLSIYCSVPSLCPHYSGRIIRDIPSEKKSPSWLVERLEKSGLQSISPVVDVTNYVLLELGQPLHAFDLEKVKDQLHIRYAKVGEKLRLLDDTDIELHERTIVIADLQQPLALAGIKGGLDSSVTENTRHIFLESAFFDPTTVSVTARQYGMHSDSSYRFARGVDPQLHVKALEYATSLLVEIAGGEPGKLSQVGQLEALPKNPLINLRFDRLQKILNHSLDKEFILIILKKLGMLVMEKDDAWEVVAPSYRFDIQIEEDLIEEVARLIGYDQFESLLPALLTRPLLESETTLPNPVLAQCLQARGYHEVMTYSFVDRPSLQLFDEREPVTLQNPLSLEVEVMRSTLWPSLLKVLEHNLNHQKVKRLRIFEMATQFTQQGETPVLSGLVMGALYPDVWTEDKFNKETAKIDKDLFVMKKIDFFDVKSDLEAIFHLTHQEVAFKKSSHKALHPGRTAEIVLNNKSVGYIGQLHPKIAQEKGLPDEIYLFELSLTELKKVRLPQFCFLSKFPAVRRDLCFYIDPKLEISTITMTIQEAAGNLLKSVLPFDIFLGADTFESGRHVKKSVALGLILQDFSRTLTDEEVNVVIQRVIDAMKVKHDASVRT